jgi:hypothetical protein
VIGQGDMKSVIMIAHDFPPEGSAGVYRSLRFVRHLPMLGWNPTVVTLDAVTYERYDPSLLQQIPQSIHVERVAAHDIWASVQRWRFQRRQLKMATVPDAALRIHRAEQGRLRTLTREVVRQAEAWCYHPDMAMRWIRPAATATARMGVTKKAEVIWATAGPVSALVAAERASRLTRIPYVLDFRDAWTITYNEFDAKRPGWARRRDRRLLYHLLSRARAVVFRYATEVECYWRAYPGALDVGRVHMIPNGFEGAIDWKPIPARGDKCTVLYGGTLSSYRWDTLLQGLRFLKSTDPARAARLRVRFVGEGTESLAHEAAKLDLWDIVEALGPTTHDEIAEQQRQAHALLVLGRPPTMEGHELFAGAKLFGYLKAARPIIGVLPCDETRRILDRVAVSTIADGNAIAEIASVFTRLLDAWQHDKLHSLVPNRAACEGFSAERQTAALARALEGQPASELFVPNSVGVPPSLSLNLSTFDHDGTPAYT